MLTNINISDNENLFKYIIEVESDSYTSIPISYSYNKRISKAISHTTFLNKIVRDGNIWTSYEDTDILSTPTNEYIPREICDEHPSINYKEIPQIYLENPGGDNENIIEAYRNTQPGEYVPYKISYFPCGDSILSFSNIKLLYNDWKINEIENKDRLLYKQAKVKVYFPGFSIDTYHKGTKYAIDICTWINGCRIDIGSCIFNRSDALACGDKKFFGDIYNEYIEFNIIDPVSLLYSDDWAEFREKVCFEEPGTNISEAIVYISLYPVEKYEDHYVMIDGYSGGQNSINIFPDNCYITLHLIESDNLLPTIDDITIQRYWNVVNNYNYVITDNTSDLSIPLTNIENYYWDSSELDIIDDDPNSLYEILTTDDVLSLYDETYKKDWIPHLRSVITFNEYYESLEEYIHETYGAEGEVTIKYELAVRDKDNIYWKTESENVINKYTFDKFPKNIFNWKWYNEYINTHDDNIYFQCIATILVDNLELMYIRSNNIPITQELFSYFINTPTKFIELDKINMNIYNLNIIDKTVNEIIQVDNPSDSKSNIIQPVFFKARDAENIVVHPRFTENICINLNAFKSKVDKFILQIEGVNFTEIGRIASGIIFKIIGSRLPGSLTEGTYIILDENGDGVTTGKYTYE